MFLTSSVENLDLNWNYILSFIVDLSTVLPEWVNVGFSAATGEFNQSHTILSWSFNSSFREEGIHGNTLPNNKNVLVLGIGFAVSLVTVMSCGLVLLWFICWSKKESGSVNVYYVMGFRPSCFTCIAHLYLYYTLLVLHTYASYIRHRCIFSHYEIKYNLPVFLTWYQSYCSDLFLAVLSLLVLLHSQHRLCRHNSRHSLSPLNLQRLPTVVSLRSSTPQTTARVVIAGLIAPITSLEVSLRSSSADLHVGESLVVTEASTHPYMPPKDSTSALHAPHTPHVPSLAPANVTCDVISATLALADVSIQSSC